MGLHADRIGHGFHLFSKEMVKAESHLGNDGGQAFVQDLVKWVSRTTTVIELRKAIENFQLSPKQVRDLIINGFKRSFYPGPYEERRAYVRKVTDFYDRMVLEHGIGPSL